MMDKEMKARIHTAIRRTFEVIAGDLEAMGPVDLDVAVECSIDADRTRTFGGDDEAADALYALTWPEMKKLGKAALKGYF